MCSQKVLKMLPSGSHHFSQVLNVFPKMFPLPPFFKNPILFAHGSTSMYINQGRNKGMGQQSKRLLIWAGMHI